MKNKLLSALRADAKGNIEKHLANIEVYLTNPVGVGEHPDIISAIQHEISEVDKYKSQLSIIDEYLDESNGNIQLNG